MLGIKLNHQSEMGTLVTEAWTIIIVTETIIVAEYGHWYYNLLWIRNAFRKI